MSDSTSKIIYELLGVLMEDSLPGPLKSVSKYVCMGKAPGSLGTVCRYYEKSQENQVVIDDWKEHAVEDCAYLGADCVCCCPEVRLEEKLREL